MAKALNSEIPSCIVKSIEEAQSYAEGRSFRVDVKSQSDLSWIKQLIDIKEKA